MFNNRELASLMLLLGGGVFVAVKSRSTVGPALRDMGRQLLDLRLLIPLAVLVAYTVGIVVAGARLGAWDRTMLFGTLVWFATIAFASYVNIGAAQADEHFVRRVVLRTVEIAAVLEFAAGIFVLSLPFELVLQAAIVMITLLVTVAAMDREHAAVARVGNGLLAVAGLGVLAFSATQIWRNRSALELDDLALQAVLPVWLTLAFVPLLYLFGLFVAYDAATRRLWYRGKDLPRLARLRALLALVVTFRGRRSSLSRLDFYVARQMVEANSLRGAMEAAREQLDEEQRRDDEARVAELRLIENAGVQGTDAEGRRLDQREFAETREALRWLHTCHMGHYRNTGRYRSDLLPIVSDSPQFEALPDGDHGIQMRVSDDGQTWWAWRETITDWVMGIGASGPPPSQFLYDASEAPSAGPRADGDGWTSILDHDLPPNW